jgi:uncharacterized protein (TIGR03000 family)
MARFRSALLGLPAVAGLLVTASAALAWDLGGPLYAPPPASYYGYNLDDPHPGYYGGGHYREYYNFGRGYGVANFPLPLPRADDYLWPNYPPLFHRHRAEPEPVFLPAPVPGLILPADTTVQLFIQVPENATVSIDGAATRQTGTTRQFASPPLAPGKEYSYEVRARWTAAGKTVEQTQNVTVRAGDRLNVTFPVAEPALPFAARSGK